MLTFLLLIYFHNRTGILNKRTENESIQNEGIERWDFRVCMYVD